MALTNAERQKLYRERQKNKNKDEYLKKEAKWKRGAYIHLHACSHLLHLLSDEKNLFEV
jgi:hypothetical protein